MTVHRSPRFLSADVDLGIRATARGTSGVPACRPLPPFWYRSPKLATCHPAPPFGPPASRRHCASLRPGQAGRQSPPACVLLPKAGGGRGTHDELVFPAQPRPERPVSQPSGQADGRPRSSAFLCIPSTDWTGPTALGRAVRSPPSVGPHVTSSTDAVADTPRIPCGPASGHPVTHGMHHPHCLQVLGVHTPRWARG